jgi:hypothetical protein
MSHQHEHTHDKGHHHEHHAPKKKIHHDWRFWAVILMLVGMGIYVMSMNEAFWPGEPMQQEVPADAE